MKKVVITLDETSKTHRWPGEGFLAYRQGESDYWEHCCIGCHGLAMGIDAVDMRDSRIPRGDVGSSRFAQIWHTKVPEDIFDEIKARFPRLAEYVSAEPGAPAMIIAAAINDDKALYRYRVSLADAKPVREASIREARDSAVAALRVLFTWLGQQHNEEWVINHIPDPGV